MIDKYLEGAIKLARERAKVLKGKIPNPVPIPEFIGLQKVCEQRIDRVIALLDYLLHDPLITKKDSENARIRLFRRALDDLAQLEATGVAALNRQNEDDVFLNRLVFQIHKEIGYPLAPPAVTCLSQHYFLVYPELCLLAVPLAESDFLLHLPDLYHELAHPLISTPNNPKLEAFQIQFAKFQASVLVHFQKERAAVLRSTGPKEYFGYVVDILEKVWVEFWGAELFCDLFAVYTLGPAYAWTHFHLTATRKADPFEVRIDRLMSHPPDQARMDVILMGLDLLGRKAEVSDIQARWKELLKTTGAKRHSLYERACPKLLLEIASTYALEGIKGIGCKIAGESDQGNISKTLNEAWQEFWKSPSNYQNWEKKKLANMKQGIAS